MVALVDEEVIVAAVAVEADVINLEEEAASNAAKKATFPGNAPTNLPVVAVWVAIVNVTNAANRVISPVNVPKEAQINVSGVKKKVILAEIVLKVVETTVLIVMKLVTCREIALKKSK